MEIAPTNYIFPRHKVTKFDIWALGITVVIGGQYFSWNEGLDAGFGSFAIASLLIASAYGCLCMCTSEISSVMPFAGGAYGLARCTMGFYAGFIIGCCEIMEYIIYVANSTILLGRMLSAVFPSWSSFQPLMWFIFYFSALFFHVRGGRTFWYFNKAFALASLAILMIYCFGSFKWINFDKYSSYESNEENIYFVGGIYQFIKVLPLATWFFVGVEGLNFACDDVEFPKKIIPAGQVSCIFTLQVTAMLVLFVASSIAPGVKALADALNPLDNGFMQMFAITKRAATMLSFPATYATAFGFMYPYGKLMLAMANSNLLPKQLGYRYGESGSPYVALIVGSIIGYLICILVYCIPTIRKHLFNICILSGFIAYMSQCIGYIFLKRKFGHLRREYKSTLGIPGAIFAFLVSGIGAISIIGFQNDKQFALIVLSCTVFILSIYYLAVVRNIQTLSEDEKSVLFVAHIVNFDESKQKEEVKKHQQDQSLSMGKFTQRYFLHHNINNSRSSSRRRGEQKHPHDNHVTDIKKIHVPLAWNDDQEELVSMRKSFKPVPVTLEDAKDRALDDFYVLEVLNYNAGKG